MSDPAGPKTPAPSGDTPLSVILCGVRRDKNGNDIATPISIDPNGALATSQKNKGFTGVYYPLPGDRMRFNFGRFQGPDVAASQAN